MSLRKYLVEVATNLDKFLEAAGRPNATVVALRNHVQSVAAGDDRALDVTDPRELRRGFDPESGTIADPAKPGERLKVAPTPLERAEADAKAAEAAPVEPPADGKPVDG